LGRLDAGFFFILWIADQPKRRYGV